MRKKKESVAGRLLSAPLCFLGSGGRRCLVGEKPCRVKVPVDEGETLELFLVDCADHLDVDGRQDGLFFRELRVEVQGIFLALLQKNEFINH